MKQPRMVASVVVLLLCGVFVHAQQVVATNTNIAVPPLVNFSGTLTDTNGIVVSRTCSHLCRHVLLERCNELGL